MLSKIFARLTKVFSRKSKNEATCEIMTTIDVFFVFHEEEKENKKNSEKQIFIDIFVMKRKQGK